MGSELIRACGVALLCAIGTMMLRGKNGEIAALLRVGGLVLLTGLLLLSLREPLGEIQEMLASSVLSSYVTVLLKAIGIGILCATCAEICRECGDGSLASCVEAVGNVLILSLCIPIIRDILEEASSLLAVG